MTRRRRQQPVEVSRSGRSGRGRVFLFAAAVALVAVGCSEDPGPPPVVTPKPPVAKKPAGKLSAAKGAVSLTRGGKTEPAKPQDVFVNDVIETGADGEAELDFGGSLVSLGPNGRFEVEEGGAGVTLELEKGFLSGKGGSGEGVLLSIGTPFGMTRVLSGAELKITIGDDDATVEVALGEVELLNKSGESSKVGAGQKGRFGKVLKELAPLEFVIDAGGAKAEVKAQGAKKFVAVNPRRPPKLGEGDTVRVKSGRLRLSAKGGAAEVGLSKGAEVVVGGIGGSDSVEQQLLELKKGTLSVDASGSKRARLAVGSGVTLESAQQGQYEVARSKSGFTLTAPAGDVTVEREGKDKVVVPGGSTATITDADVAVRPIGKEPVSLPTRNGLKLYHSGLKQVSLTWSGDGGKPYRVVVASDSGLKRKVLEGVVHDTHVTVDVPRRGTLYWRVYDGDKELDRGNLMVAGEETGKDLSRLKNEVPDGAEKTTIYYQDKPPVVTFTWEKEDGAAKHKVVVYRDGDLSNPVSQRVVTETRLSLPEGTLGEGKYLWSMTPLSPAGEELRGGKLNKLEIQYDNAVPNLVIRSPKNGERGGKQVTAAGIAPVGARVFINGKAASLDDKSRFEETVSPLPGGRVVFRMVNGGAEVYTVRTVRGGG